MNVMRVVHGVYLHVAEMCQIPCMRGPSRIEATPHIAEKQYSWMHLIPDIEIALQREALTVVKYLGSCVLRKPGSLLSFDREGI